MKVIVKLAFLFVAFAAAHVAQAQNSYVEISGGQAQLKKFCDGVVGPCDDNGTAFKVFIGHNFTTNVGGEIGYVNSVRSMGPITRLDSLLRRKQGLRRSEGPLSEIFLLTRSVYLAKQGRITRILRWMRLLWEFL